MSSFAKQEAKEDNMTEGNIENKKENAPSDAQRKYLFTLLKENQIDKEELEGTIDKPISTLTKPEMSKVIDMLINSGDKRGDLRKWGLNNESTSEPKKETPTETKNTPEKKETTAMAAKKPMTIGKPEQMAQVYGIPTELANMYFMTYDSNGDKTLYIKQPGLLYLAAKKGYARIYTTSSYNEEKKEWEAETSIYPIIPKEVIISLGNLDKEMQKQVLDTYYGPTKGYGRASKENVKMSTMHVFLKEMAETRSVNRALRLYTGYCGTSYEEMPNSTIETEVQ